MEVELLDEESHPPEGFDLDEYISSGAFGLLRSADQQVVAEDEKYLTLQATVPDTAQLEWWLMSFGADAEVLEPVALREKLAAIAREMAERYGKSDKLS